MDRIYRGSSPLVLNLLASKIVKEALSTGLGVDQINKTHEVETI